MLQIKLCEEEVSAKIIHKLIKGTVKNELLVNKKSLF